MAGFHNESERTLGRIAASSSLEKRAQIPSRRKNEGRATGMPWIPPPKSWYRRLEALFIRYGRLHLGNVGYTTSNLHSRLTMSIDIAFLSDGPVTIQECRTWGGTEATLHLVSRWLADKGLNVAIISPTKNERKQDGVSYFKLGHWLDYCPVKVYMRRMIISLPERKHSKIAFS